MNESQKGAARLKRCSRCLTPETHETISFDGEGVCNICRGQEYKQAKIDWVAREKEFRELIEQYRGQGSHDCIIPFSGGKDSTWTVYKMVTDYKVKPLVVSFDHNFFRPHMMNNNLRTLSKLGVDFHLFRVNWKVIRKLILESLLRKGDFCWHCHAGLFAYPMQVAVKFNIPLVIWGEPSAEYTSYYSYENPEEVDEKRFNRFINLGITAEDMVGMLDDEVTLRDLEPFRYPSLKELRSIKCRSVCLGSYIPWDVKKQSAIIRDELGWRGAPVEGVPPEYYYEKIECMFTGVRDYLKYIKRGYARSSHLASIDIRNKCLSREEGERLVKEFEGKRPASLDVFLKAIGMSEEEFMKIALSHMVAPYKHDVEWTQRGPKLPDQDEWVYNEDLS